MMGLFIFITQALVGTAYGAAPADSALTAGMTADWLYLMGLLLVILGLTILPGLAGIIGGARLRSIRTRMLLDDPSSMNTSGLQAETRAVETSFVRSCLRCKLLYPLLICSGITSLLVVWAILDVLASGILSAKGSVFPAISYYLTGKGALRHGLLLVPLLILNGWLAAKYFSWRSALSFLLLFLCTTICIGKLGSFIQQLIPAMVDSIAFRQGATLSLFSLFWGVLLASLWSIMSRKSRTEAYSSALEWLAEAYIVLKDSEKLKDVLATMAKHQTADVEVRKWLEANLAVLQKNRARARSLLLELPALARNDFLLFKVCSEDGEWSIVEKRASRHSIQEAVRIIKMLPASISRDRVLIKLWANKRSWREVESILQRLSQNDAVDALRELRQTEERDAIMIPLAFKAGRYDVVLSAVSRLNLKDALRLINSLLPPSADRDKVIIRVLVHFGAYGAVKTFISRMPADQVESVLDVMPPGIEKDKLLCAFWMSQGRQQQVVAHLSEREVAEAIGILEHIEKGVARDPILALFLEKAGAPDKVVAVLEPHNAANELGVEDIRRLARGYYAIGEHPKAISTLEGAFSQHPDDTENMPVLCSTCIACDRRSNLIESLNRGDLGRCGADALWSLIGYHNHFGDSGKAREAAEMGTYAHSDERSALFLGNLLEKESSFLEAGKVYKIAGTSGLFRRAMCHFHLEEYSEAKDLFEQVDETEDNRMILHYHKGYSLYRLGKIEEAISEMNHAEPEHMDWELQYDIAILLETLAKSAIHGGNHEEALRRLDEASARLPANQEEANARIGEEKAYCYYQLAWQMVHDPSSSPVDVERLIAKAIEHVSSPWPQLIFLQGLNQLKGGDTNEALKSFALLSRRHPENRQFRFHKALSAHYLGQRAYARGEFELLAGDNGHDNYGSRSRLLLGAFALQDSDWKAAEECFQSLIHTQ